MMEKSPDVQLGIGFTVWNVGCMSRKCGEIPETLKRQCVDICCLQEVMWKRQGTKILKMVFNFFGVEVVK